MSVCVTQGCPGEQVALTQRQGKLAGGVGGVQPLAILEQGKLGGGSDQPLAILEQDPPWSAMGVHGAACS